MRRYSSRALQAAKLALPMGFLVGVIATTSNEGIAQGPPPPVGGPLVGLTPAELQRFDAGRQAFLRNAVQQSGLGPVFNGTACAQCHAAGAPGGASVNLGVSVVTRIGAIVNGAYSDLTNVGGALLQRRSLREFIPNYPVPGEVVPPQATIVGRRITTPVFGNGLMEAIPPATILARQDPTDVNRDGISGRANMVLNPITRVTEVGRFGWKCQVSSVHVFSGDAYLNEMGITSPFFNTEVRPQGQPLPPGADNVPDPEDRGDVVRVADYMRFIAPPPTAVASTVGRALFTSVGCASCHTPSMATGPNTVAALANKQVNLYSDLLLHDMGAQLGDGLRQGQASGTEFRTAPLWGLRFRRFYLHDGRTQSVDQAIRLHGGEAAGTIGRYNLLSLADRNALLTFVQGL